MGQGPLPAPQRAAGLLPAPETPPTGISLAGLPAARPRGPWTLSCFPRGCTRPSRAGFGARAWACSGCRGGPGGEGGLMEAKPPWGQGHGVAPGSSRGGHRGSKSQEEARRRLQCGKTRLGGRNEAASPATRRTAASNRRPHGGASPFASVAMAAPLPR